MDRITIKHLRGACKDQRMIFRETFPKGAPLTGKAMAKAVAADLDVLWLRRLLKGPAQDAFYVLRGAAMNAFHAAVQLPAGDIFDESMRPALLAAVQPAGDIFDAAVRSALLAALQSQE